VKKFLQSWLIGTLAVLVAVYMVNGIHYLQWVDLCVASLLLGILNAVLRPMLMVLSLPLLILTLGLFRLVINGLLLWFVGSILGDHFRVDGFWPAFKGALVISVVSIILSSLTGTGEARVRVQRGARRPPPPGPHDGNGPVIDV
jgi:putative membrane protein